LKQALRKKGAKNVNCHRLLCKCSCGGFAQPLSFWLTDQKSLMVTCYCIVCESQVNVAFPLSELFKSCPLPTLSLGEGKPFPQLPRVAEELTDEDVDILRQAHIDPGGRELT
jgi:hypothetical protein